MKILLITFLLFTNTLFANDKLDQLKQSLDAIVAAADGNVSVQVVSASKYDLLYSYNPGTKMIPASITKVVTACIALKYLGVDYKFKTIVYTDGTITDGVVNGNIYLKGYGDPDLNSSDISFLAQKVSEKNIKSVTGNVIYDESFLDNNYYGLSNYYKGDTRSQYWPYVSALNLDKNQGGYNPAATAGELFASELVRFGVQFSGSVVSGVTPPASKEIAEVSHSIFDVLSWMNKESDNHSAITVFKVVGAVYDSPPGTLQKGESAAIDFLTQLGNDRGSFEILEGSGLTRNNTVNSDMFIRILKYMYDDVKTFDYFYNSLAVGGVDGTLKNRMKQGEAYKNVRAKTGTLNGVSTLSGYAISRDNELIMFYIAMNGFSSDRSYNRKIQDDICEVICQFSRY
ncbi:MAG TPA: D-alanyl-D-alanine carboxypeptidase/D-alanyl-D-alanine-endopeptidase [Bacteroidetes bacterium]|nr:D-alanyl-D-alanine carboxypeptidase/D-alanyl-D-alanine-endopeptidase [Bacteroidota bacterium]HCN37577.1 D-alanyl-D-alanine carboxypeptidase/D-alanyl-D-alanine-endopeptidase [Bacteroidota bacterium]